MQATIEKVYASATLSASNAFPGSSDTDAATVTPGELPPEKLMLVPKFNRPVLFVFGVVDAGIGVSVLEKRGALTMNGVNADFCR